MGWASAGAIFNPIAQALINLGAPDEMKREILGKLIGVLQGEDWDTEEESLDRFADDPVIVQAFADHGVPGCNVCGGYECDCEEEETT
jgi:hypothetical protein